MLSFYVSCWFLGIFNPAQESQETIKKPKYKKIFILGQEQGWQILLGCLSDSTITCDRQKILTIFNPVGQVLRTLYRKSPNKTYIAIENEFKIKAIISF